MKITKQSLCLVVLFSLALPLPVLATPGEESAVSYTTAPWLGSAPDSLWAGRGAEFQGYYGHAVNSAGDINGDGYDDVIVGTVNEGRVYVYHGGAAGLSRIAKWVGVGEGGFYGMSVASAGDVNGDGYDDVVVGAHLYNVNETGRAYVYYGSALGLSAEPDWTADGSVAHSAFGASVAGAGDVNGDGYDDVIIGAREYYVDLSDQGAAFVYLGSSSGLSAAPDWRVVGDGFEGNLGDAVNSAGDVNGDGFDDVVVGAKSYSVGWLTREGRAYLYFGSPAGLSSVADWTATGDTPAAGLGNALATAGDVNHDGYDDLIIGARGYNHDQQEEGRAYIYYGSASGPSLSPDWTAEGDQIFAYFGASVSTAGDMNDDGYDDVIVGVPGYDHGQTTEGRAYMYLGSAAGLRPRAAFSVESNKAWATLGNAVGAAGDVNGDGFAEFIVGAERYSFTYQGYEGLALVFGR